MKGSAAASAADAGVSQTGVEIVRRVLLLELLLLTLVGCATMPSQQEIANLDYGQPISIDYKKAIKTFFAETLYDPYSAHYRFGTPTKIWIKDPPLAGGGITAGYAVATKINAKNRLGGYTGYQNYLFIFKNDSIIRALDPDDLSMMRGGIFGDLLEAVPPESPE